MAQTVRMRLNSSSINDAYEQVKAFRQGVERAIKSLLESLVDYGVERVKYHIMTARPTAIYEDGDLLNSVEGVVNLTMGKGFVRVNSEYAIYVELGTGVYVPSEANSKYGDAGWWYYDKSRGGQKRWTKGEPPRPFMYQTFMDMCEKASEMMREM